MEPNTALECTHKIHTFFAFLCKFKAVSWQLNCNVMQPVAWEKYIIFSHHASLEPTLLLDMSVSHDNPLMLSSLLSWLLHQPKPKIFLTECFCPVFLHSITSSVRPYFFSLVSYPTGNTLSLLQRLITCYEQVARSKHTTLAMVRFEFMSLRINEDIFNYLMKIYSRMFFLSNDPISGPDSHRCKLEWVNYNV